MKFVSSDTLRSPDSMPLLSMINKCWIAGTPTQLNIPPKKSQIQGYGPEGAVARGCVITCFHGLGMLWVRGCSKTFQAQGNGDTESAGFSTKRSGCEGCVDCGSGWQSREALRQPITFGVYSSMKKCSFESAFSMLEYQRLGCIRSRVESVLS